MSFTATPQTTFQRFSSFQSRTYKQEHRGALDRGEMLEAEGWSEFGRKACPVKLGQQSSSVVVTVDSTLF